ncbi:MAG: HTH-type transcriptional activator RhaS [Lentisphaerae bacterium ADurb.Bin242]|nr:MAG: HTH-type transcriptional activator RhaS [Lentisphaerae bacterium ADurb.Bin242]
MLKTSKIKNIGFYDPISLDPTFPVTFPGYKQPPHDAHIHNCFEIGLCTTGSGIFLIGNKIFTCSPGDVCFINNREFHLLQHDTPSNSKWDFINLDPVRLLAGGLPEDESLLDLSRFSGDRFQNLVHQSDAPELNRLVTLLIDELEHRKKGFRDSVRGIVWTLLVLLHRRCAAPADETASCEGVDMIYPALRYIARHYRRPVRIEELAKLCHCSISTFRRQFIRSMKVLPVEYILEFRLKSVAARLLNSREPVSALAWEHGFGNLANFNRQFKAFFGCSPREYRASSQRGLNMAQNRR